MFKRQVDTGREKESGMNREVSIDIYTLPCVKEIASGDRQHRELDLVLCEDREGWDGWGTVEGPRRRGYMYTYS